MAKASQRCFRNDMVPTVSAKAHKNPDFVLEMPENGGFEGKKRTKTPILCSEGAKTREISPFLTQKCRFCAREERKLASGSATVAFLQITAHTSEI